MSNVAARFRRLQWRARMRRASILKPLLEDCAGDKVRHGHVRQATLAKLDEDNLNRLLAEQL